MQTVKLAVPTNNPGGMQAGRSDHFGHCDLFTLVNIENGKVVDVETVNNVEHGAGGCMEPVQHLKDQNVDVIVVGGMGKRPLNGFSQVGIKVYFAGRQQFNDVETVVDGFLQNRLTLMLPEQACKGGANCHH